MCRNLIWLSTEIFMKFLFETLERFSKSHWIKNVDADDKNFKFKLQLQFRTLPFQHLINGKINQIFCFVIIKHFYLEMKQKAKIKLQKKLISQKRKNSLPIKWLISLSNYTTNFEISAHQNQGNAKINGNLGGKEEQTIYLYIKQEKKSLTTVICCLMCFYISFLLNCIPLTLTFVFACVLKLK